MLFADLLSPHQSGRVAEEMLGLAGTLYPICRSITGNGVRQTLDVLGSWIPLERYEVPSGTRAFDWDVPDEWNVDDAFIADAAGHRIVDIHQHNLHVVSYSVPVRATLSLEELQPHLHSLPDHPEWIPYRTSYYRRDWGFCLRHADRVALGPGPYQVVIESRIAPGSLTYAECNVPGTTEHDAIVYAHTCHPSLANDNLSGIVIATALARAMRAEKPRLTWRFVFGPGTIGSITWLSRNEGALTRIRTGLVLGLLGDSAALTYKRSRRGDTVTDRTAELVLPRIAEDTRFADFKPYGYDERQFCSPGIDLPFGRLSRSDHGGYPEYHSSADNLELLRAGRLAESLQAAAALIAALDVDRRPISLCPKGEPQLGRRGLYGGGGGPAPLEYEHALLWVLSLGDGQHTLVDIARRSGLALDILDRAAAALEAAELIRCPAEQPGSSWSASK